MVQRVTDLARKATGINNAVFLGNVHLFIPFGSSSALSILKGDLAAIWFLLRELICVCTSIFLLYTE